MRLTRRALLRRAALYGAGTALAVALSRAGEPPRARAADAPTGLIAIPRGREVVLVAADGSGERTIVSLPTGEFVADVALSPDRSLVAFGRFNAPPGGPGGADIVLMPTDGSAPPRTVAERDGRGTLLAAPYFLPDGRGLLFEVIGIDTNGLPTVRADMVHVDGSGRRTFAEDGRFPTVSADGQVAAYVKSGRNGDSVWVRTAGEPERQIVSDRDLLIVSFPRFSPDGARMIVAGVGHLERVAQKLAPADATLGPSDPSRTERLSAVAAHGLPVDPWMVGVDGGGLHRVALMSIDDAAVAWSPDGQLVAVAGADGVRLLSPSDGSLTQISEGSSFGAIDWR